MRRNYTIAALAASFLAGTLPAAPCPSDLTAVASRVAALRGVAGPLSPPCRTVSVAALRGELDAKLRRDLPLPPVEFLELLHRLGFIDGEPATVYPALLDFYAEQVLGFYEPGADEMVIVDRPPPPGGTGLVWAHELAHAAQERRSHLPTRLLAMRANGDEQRAASAVAEGEAMLVMFLATSPVDRAAEVLDSAATLLAAQQRTFKGPPGVPEFFVEELLFPYTDGFQTVLQAWRTGGWGPVDRLLDRPPASTALLLHRERQVGAALSDSALPPVPEGWREVVTDTVGEWALGFWLGRGSSHSEAKSVAAGWSADRVRVIRSVAAPDQWALAWRFRCRDDASRRQLQRALTAVAPTLFGRLAGRSKDLPFTWVSSGPELELRAAWPNPSQPRRRPSPSG